MCSLLHNPSVNQTSTGENKHRQFLDKHEQDKQSSLSWADQIRAEHTSPIMGISKWKKLIQRIIQTGKSMKQTGR